MSSRWISNDHEALFRRLLAPETVVEASDLVTRLMRCGHSRSQAHHMISRAAACGLLLRMCSSTPYWYQLDATWKREERAQAAVQPPTAAGAYVGPAFDSGPLAPALGLACGEVPPPEVCQIVDALHRNFYEQFHGVE